GDARGGLMLAPVMTLAFLAGHAQEAYYLALALGAWAGLEVIATLARAAAGAGRRQKGRPCDAPDGPSQGRRTWLWAGVIAASTLGMTAIEWRPDAEALAWGLKGAGMSQAR